MRALFFSPLLLPAHFHRLDAMAKILVVDDEITMIQITSELLKAEGHEVFRKSGAIYRNEGTKLASAVKM